MACQQFAESACTVVEASSGGEAPARKGRPARHILIYASPGCGAENFLRTLAQLKNFTCIHNAYFPVARAALIASAIGRPPGPGLHFLTDYSGVLKALRRLMDSIIDPASAAISSGSSTRIMYSPDNVFNVSVLRRLYPDALHLHFVRNVSRGTLRMADEAGLRAWRLCARWRASERALLNASPWPNQVTIPYEEFEHSPADTARAIMNLACVPFTVADQDAFAQHFAISRTNGGRTPLSAAAPGREVASARRGDRIGRLAERCAAVCCQAELAALRYNTSVGRPGSLRALAATGTLRLISWLGAGGGETIRGCAHGH
jgi:hypothetical protein